mgnify:CR=1 FL=1
MQKEIDDEGGSLCQNWNDSSNILSSWSYKILAYKAMIDDQWVEKVSKKILLLGHLKNSGKTHSYGGAIVAVVFASAMSH